MRATAANGGRWHGLDHDDVRPSDVDRARRRLDGDSLVVDRRDDADDVGEGRVRAGRTPVAHDDPPPQLVRAVGHGHRRSPSVDVMSMWR